MKYAPKNETAAMRKIQREVEGIEERPETYSNGIVDLLDEAIDGLNDHDEGHARKYLGRLRELCKISSYITNLNH